MDITALMSGYKTITAYYTYGVSGDGTDNILFSTDNHNRNEYDEALRNFINLMIQVGAAASQSPNDNKTGVRVKVHGIDFPLYFYKYDGAYYITKSINKSKTTEKRLFWNVEN